MSYPGGQRAFPRFEVRAYCDVGVKDPTARRLEVRNISMGGICIHTKDIQDVGTIVDLAVTFPDLDIGLLEVRGVVVWVNREPPSEIGIRFLDLDPQRAETLREYLRRNALARETTNPR